MRVKTKRIWSMVLALCLMLTMLPFLTLEAEATTKITDSSKVSGSDYSAAYAAKLDNIFQGKVSLFSNTTAKFALGKSLNNSKQYYVANGTISGYQCYIYAQAVYYYLFGDIPYHGTGLSGGKYWTNSTRVLKNQATISYEKLLDAGVGFGAYLRTTANSDGSYSSDYGHSLIILAYDEKNITYLEGNADGYGLVRITIKTWSEFNNDLLTNKGRKVSHIVQCNAPEAQRCVHTYAGCGVCESCGYAFNWEDTLTKTDAGYYKVTTGFTPRTDMPYSDATKDTVTIKEGEFVSVTGSVTNAFGNKWYKITYGNGKTGYVYNTYLQKNDYLDKCTTYPSYCTIKATADTMAMTLPCSTGTNADSVVVKTVSKDSTYTAVALILNDQGNHWYQIKTADGKTAYLPAGKMEFVEALTTDLTITGATAPSKLDVGKSFSIAGTIKSTYNEIYKVSAYVYPGTSASGTSATGGADTVNGKSYSLKSSNVDSKVKFNTLESGIYTYAVYATYKCYYADTEKTSTTSTGKVCLYTATFTVGDGVTLPAPPSEGVQNIVKRARQMTNIQWTPQADIKGWGGGVTYKKGVTYTGLPYGQPVDAKYVPWDTSLTGFINAVNNPDSKMYTGTATYNKVAPYYSIDCSAFVSWAWGLSSRQTTSTIKNFATKISDSSYEEMEIGDCLCEAGNHAVLITDIKYDSNGKIIAVEISEATTGSTNYLCHSVWYGSGYSKSMSDFQKNYLDSGYILYRCKTRDSVTYTHYCCVPLEGDVCSDCAAANCSHAYESKVTTEATCTTNGVLTYTCSKCGTSYTETIEATGHSYGEWTEVKAPTTTETGLSERVCAGCGDVEQKVLDKLEVPVDPNAAQIVIDNMTVRAGDTISVPVYISNNPGLAYAKLKISYGSSLELVSVENQGVLTGTFTTSQSTDVKPYIIQWMGADNATENGCIAILTFRVAEDAEGRTVKINVSCEEAYNSALSDVEITSASAMVSVTSVTPGDVNDDGAINGKDGILLAQYLAEWGVSINEAAADVNNDGVINGKDGVLLAQYLAEWDVVLG